MAGSAVRRERMAAGLGSPWWQYLVLVLAVAASWVGVPLIGTTALGASRWPPASGGWTWRR
jgi:hypothetical protein